MCCGKVKFACGSEMPLWSRILFCLPSPSAFPGLLRNEQGLAREGTWRVRDEKLDKRKYQEMP